jgi:hypothetical protein
LTNPKTELQYNMKIKMKVMKSYKFGITLIPDKIYEAYVCETTGNIKVRHPISDGLICTVSTKEVNIIEQ